MYEVYIHKAYDADILTDLLNSHFSERVDGVVMIWEDNSSLFINKLTGISITEFTSEIQGILDGALIDVDPD